MFALSVRQPWAALIAAGHKPVENRTWKATSSLIGQTIAIHASQGMDKDDRDWHEELLEHPEFGMVPYADLVRGAVVAKAVVLGFYNDSQDPRRVCGPDQKEFGRIVGSEPFCRWYVSQSWGWVLGDVRAVVPVPVKGSLGVWKLPTWAVARLQEVSR